MLPAGDSLRWVLSYTCVTETGAGLFLCCRIHQWHCIWWGNCHWLCHWGNVFVNILLNLIRFLIFDLIWLNVLLNVIYLWLFSSWTVFCTLNIFNCAVTCAIIHNILPSMESLVEFMLSFSSADVAISFAETHKLLCHIFLCRHIHFWTPEGRLLLSLSWFCIASTLVTLGYRFKGKVSEKMQLYSV